MKNALLPLRHRCPLRRMGRYSPCPASMPLPPLSIAAWPQPSRHASRHNPPGPRPASFEPLSLRNDPENCSFGLEGNFMSTRALAQTSVLALLSFVAAPAAAQSIGGSLQSEYVIVTANRGGREGPTAPDVQITAAKAQEQINTVNTEDMLKYAPSLVVRKRHYGDTQDPVATRTSGVGASARNLIFVDGVMISSPIGNNNSAASPHFGVAAPQDVARIDVLYGPFSARYAGNSIGATINITTRMPNHFELYADALGAVQDFHLYGANSSPGTWQISAGGGGRDGAFSLRPFGNHPDFPRPPIGPA